MNAARKRRMEVILELTVPFETGLHLLPASRIARICAREASPIEFRCGDRSADGRSVLELLALGAARGEPIQIRGWGAGSLAALEDLRSLFSPAPA